MDSLVVIHLCMVSFNFKLAGMGDFNFMINVLTSDLII